MSKMPTVFAFKNFLTDKIESSNTTIETFINDLRTRESWALTWSDRVFQAVAFKQVSTHWLTSVTAWQEKFLAKETPEGAPQNEFEAMTFVVTHMRKEVLRRAESPSQSSSVTNNLLEQHITMATAEILRYVEGDML